jgi:hypothetical protein
MPQETNNGKEQTSYVSVQVLRESHTALRKIAEALDVPIRDAVDQAVKEWCEQHKSAARKRMSQLLAA